MARVVGAGAADAGGKGNVNAGDGGVAFLLASAGALPGACDAVRSGRAAMAAWQNL